MSGFYYSIRMYIEKYPSVINCQDLLGMANEINELCGCEYDHLGYTLLHPDYDYRDVGVMLKNNKKNSEKFINLSIPMKYYGNEEEFPGSPSIIFELKEKDYMSLPDYVIELDYPTRDSQCLRLSIDIKEDLLLKELTLVDFKCMQDIVESKGFIINTSFLHYYWGESHRMALEGIESGLISINDLRIIDHAIEFQQDWKDKIMDVFYMNSFNKKIITKNTLDKMANIIGSKNIIEHDQKFIFKLPISKSCYLLERIILTKDRRVVKKLLEKENLCLKDTPIWKIWM